MNFRSILFLGLVGVSGVAVGCAVETGCNGAIGDYLLSIVNP